MENKNTYCNPNHRDSDYNKCIKKTTSFILSKLVVFCLIDTKKMDLRFLWMVLNPRIIKTDTRHL